ncbi:MAG: hypothetical protein KME11_09755 [Timaviella obliquedivisa GSE-PSE-MK23-08B]|nr:hypothetical protein [Timaviella obliquedivisa GSE-PSE-MK23-08B]
MQPSERQLLTEWAVCFVACFSTLYSFGNHPLSFWGQKTQNLAAHQVEANQGG